MRVLERYTVLLEHYRTLLESALVRGDGRYTMDDVFEAVETGRAHLWPGPHSVLITQILESHEKTLHFFLGAGRMDEIRRMVPVIEEWGRRQGCTRASLLGRKGWQRSFLARDGWDSTAVYMEKIL